jgi:hypothetical protein
MKRVRESMEKPIRPILFSSIILVVVATTFYVLNLLDQIIHGQLYNYGLLFDLAWANPYWSLLRIIQMLLGVIAALTSVNVIFTIRKYISTRKQGVKIASSQRSTMPAPTPVRPISPPTRTVSAPSHTVEKVTAAPVTPSVTPSVLATQAPPTTPSLPSVSTPARPSPPAPFTTEIPGMIKCSHCGKAFTQPLRMLDFQGDRPRIVSICPFCNEIITTAPRQEEDEKDSRFTFRKKNNNHTPRALASQ